MAEPVEMIAKACFRCLTALAAALPICATALADDRGDADFGAWLALLRAEAGARGISAPTLDAAFAGIRPIARIIELDRNQPEGRISFAQYRARVLPASRFAAARARLARHRAVLDEVAARFRVQPRFIVALWGLESDFGRYTGGFSVIGALTTLAYDGRRGAFFRGELIDALRILEDGQIDAAAMTGSWAGGMGQSQFLPSSYHRYAVDFDGDGRRDIWDTPGDVFASIANYLHQFGWRDDQTWGRAVRLPAKFDPALIDLAVIKPIGDWQTLGLRRADGTDLPRRALPASVIQPDGAGGQAYLVYDNFRTTLKWNRSIYGALAVGMLADGLVGR
ncbi:MAG: lytic murein transglycosylase [Alphaproteobacteria bacterium]|nr:lytic murein transglycosylase [Alphaproteobacteria bacterium]MDP6515752.1 lytic murein transglycosylase [Alphaproteobacteria bacterium]